MASTPLAIDSGVHLGRERLLELLEAEPPFATVYLRSPSSLDDAAERLDVRMRNAARRLADAGVPDDVVEEMSGLIGEGGHSGGSTRVMIANRGGLLVSGWLDEEIAADIAVTAMTPRLVPLIQAQQSSVAHVVVLIDRTGADLFTVEQGSFPQHVAVEGDTEHIHRGHPGGWSQRRFQQRAENTWESNAVEVAEALTAAIHDVSAELVVVAGDVRARGFLLDHLSDDHRRLVETIDGSRDSSLSASSVAEQIHTLTATVAAERVVAHLRTYGDRLATGDAVSGASATAQVLRRRQVERLLVVDDSASDESALAWRGDEPTIVALDPEGAGLTSTTPAVGPLTDLAIHAALRQDAEIVVVPAHGPHTPDDGIGAELRFRLDDD